MFSVPDRFKSTLYLKSLHIIWPLKLVIKRAHMWQAHKSLAQHPKTRPEEKKHHKKAQHSQHNIDKYVKKSDN